jgi:hypothetical protein
VAGNRAGHFARGRQQGGWYSFAPAFREGAAGAEAAPRRRADRIGGIAAQLLSVRRRGSIDGIADSDMPLAQPRSTGLIKVITRSSAISGLVLKLISSGTPAFD